MLKSIFAVLFVLCVFSGVPPEVHGQEALVYNLRQGDVFTVEQQAEQEITQQLEQSEHQLTNRISAKRNAITCSILNSKTWFSALSATYRANF